MISGSSMGTKTAAAAAVWQSTREIADLRKAAKERQMGRRALGGSQELRESEPPGRRRRRWQALVGVEHLAHHSRVDWRAAGHSRWALCVCFAYESGWQRRS